MSRPFSILALVLMLGSSSAYAQVGPVPPSPTAETSAREDPAPRVALRGRALRQERARVYAELAARREMNLARFEAYVARGNYPANTYQPGPMNVFIDERGRICAAATVMMEDGHADLVQTLASTNNFLAVGDAHEGPLFQWILGSGFTQEELAMIQAPFIGDGDGTVGMPDFEQMEHDRLAAVYATVLSSLREHRRTSLTTATERWIASRTS